MIKLQKKSAEIYVRVTKRWGVTSWGKTFQIKCAVRAIKESVCGGWRIDFADCVLGAWLPWEPIDEVSRPNVAACQRAITEWLAKIPEVE